MIIDNPIPAYYHYLDFNHSSRNFERQFSFTCSIRDDFSLASLLDQFRQEYHSSEIWIDRESFEKLSFNQMKKVFFSSNGGDVYFNQKLKWKLPDESIGISTFFKSFSIKYIKDEYYTDVTISFFIDLFSNEIMTMGEEMLDISVAAIDNRIIFNNLLFQIYKTLNPFRVEVSNDFDKDYLSICGMRKIE